MTKYKTNPTGKTDAVEAINAAISDSQRCGEECGNTFAQGAIVYFPVSRISRTYYPKLSSLTRTRSSRELTRFALQLSSYSTPNSSVTPETGRSSSDETASKA